MLETEQKDRADTYNNNKYNESIKDNNRPDIVLLQLPLWGMFHPPLALGLLKSSLEHNGISCKNFDLNAHTFSTRGKKYFHLWLAIDTTDGLVVPVIDHHRYQVWGKVPAHGDKGGESHEEGAVAVYGDDLQVRPGHRQA